MKILALHKIKECKNCMCELGVFGVLADGSSSNIDTSNSCTTVYKLLHKTLTFEIWHGVQKMWSFKIDTESSMKWWIQYVVRLTDYNREMVTKFGTPLRSIWEPVVLKFPTSQYCPLQNCLFVLSLENFKHAAVESNTQFCLPQKQTILNQTIFFHFQKM